jgi:hypothetical protein
LPSFRWGPAMLPVQLLVESHREQRIEARHSAPTLLQRPDAALYSPKPEERVIM